MFTGIVEEIGKIKNVVEGTEWLTLAISCKTVIEGTKIGDSIAVNGVCLTVTDVGESWFNAYVMPETYRNTSLNHSCIGSAVNLERALRLTDRLGGHLVSGHIDGTGTIKSVKAEQASIIITINAGTEILRYIVHKGSVSIDGTSLTISYIDNNCFKVSLIPHTASATILGQKKASNLVNIECDMIGKYIEKLFVKDFQHNKNFQFDKNNQLAKKDISVDLLRNNGFI